MSDRTAEILVRFSMDAITVVQTLRRDGHGVVRLTVDQFERHQLVAVLSALTKHCEAFLCGEKTKSS